MHCSEKLIEWQKVKFSKLLHDFKYFLKKSRSDLLE